MQSPILTFRPRAGGDSQRLLLKLKEAQVAFSPRAGGARLAPHGFNQISEAEKILKILSP
jgi:hypothetical protein